MPGTVSDWQVVGTRAEVALLVGSGLALCPWCELSDELTDRLTDGGTWDDLGLGEKAVEGYGSPETLAAVPGTLPLALSFGILFPAGNAQTVAGGLGLEVGPVPLGSCCSVSPAPGKGAD